MNFISKATVLVLLFDLAGLLPALSANSVLQPIKLSTLNPESESQGWGSLMPDQSVLGNPMTIGDREFTSGIGTHANSRIVYDLNGLCARFDAWVGVDAEMKGFTNSSVVFQVFGDGQKIFDSGVMRPATPAKQVEVDVRGVKKLALVVTDGGDSINWDHADWAGATLYAEVAFAGESATVEPARTAKYEIKVQNLSLNLSASGKIAGAVIDGHEKNLSAETKLGGCVQVGPTKAKKHLVGGAVEFARTLRQIISGRTLTIVDRFQPAGESVRWEVEIISDGEPWTTEITTELNYPATAETRFWTAWSDPEHKSGEWRDPLGMRPLNNLTWTLGGQLLNNDYTVLPLATIAELSTDSGWSIVFSPEDTILAGSRLATTSSGEVRFSRKSYRLGGGKAVRFAVDLVAHEADWRGGLRWMTAHYPKFFEPPNPHADAMAGCGAYSGNEDPIDVAKFMRMAFRINWKMSDDFAYMGMFIPAKSADEKWDRSGDEKAPADKPQWTNCRRLNDYARYMKTNGFYVLNYFNVTEFGKKMGGAPVKKPGDPELWKDPRAFLKHELASAVLISGNATCYAASVVDPGDPPFQKFILEQASRHVRWIPDSSGICIDRMDWLERSNDQADDGVSWSGGRPARSLSVSWSNLLAKLGPEMHAADKVIFVNPLYSRLDLLREVDGIYDEYGQEGRPLNGSALMGLCKPVLAWTYKETLQQPDADSVFQRHLLLGVYPTVPYPWNNHCVNPSPAIDKLYLDYGPLLDAMRGKKWVLAPHCVASSTPGVKVNLFKTFDGYAVPVTFGGSAESAIVCLRNLAGLASMKCVALHPGTDSVVPIPATIKGGVLELTVPLQRGCAMVKIATL